MSEKLTEENIYDLIHNKYKNLGYIVVPQVRNRPGTSNIRTADAIAISQSGLRSVDFIGFEIKTSITDFRNELRDVSKSDEIACFCNKWFIVAPKGIIPINEVPANWGVFEATKSQIRMVKEANELNPLLPSREFVAMIVRKLENENGRQKEYYRGHSDGREHQRKINERNKKELKEENDKFSKTINDFKKVSGIDMWGWEENIGKEIGEIVKLIMENRVEDRINSWEEQVSKLLKEIRDAKKQLIEFAEVKK